MDFEKEQLVLDDILKKTECIIEKEKGEIELLKNNRSIDKERVLGLIEDKQYKISLLKESLNTPYFARLNVDIDNENNDVYIGKNVIMEDEKVIVTDWRAPVSSLYYDSEIGPASFNTLDGVVDCNLNLKRQYEIEKSKLINFYDVDITSRDELLSKYLNQNNDARMKTIVSTIQREQNEVIRKRIFDNLIIQGVAGSGKTTVALHRIAYLVYNYKDIIKDSDYLVIGPNDVFLKYIKSVLPDLSVNRVNQFSYINFIKDYLNEKIDIKETINIPLEDLTDKQKSISNFKCSIKYKNMIDEFIKDYIDSLFESDIKLDNLLIIGKNTIRKEFDELRNRLDSSLDVIINLLIERLVRIVKENHSSLLTKYNIMNMELFNNESDLVKKEEIKNNLVKNRNEINKYCRSIIRKYFNLDYSASKLYRLFLKNINKYNIFNYKYINDLNISKFTYDDAAALLYIKHFLKVNEKYEKIRHTVVDEAQDYNSFNFISMKISLPSSTFSIYGDLAQGIYDYRSIKNWNEVNNLIFNNDANIIEFKKSYRTTRNIMEIADKVVNKIGFDKSELVIRTGEDVKFVKASDNVNYIKNRIDELYNKGYKTIAIISKSNKEAELLNKKLNDAGCVVNNITESSDGISNGVCTISSYMSKGLEFDAVIIDDCSNTKYSSDTELKLLYISITRALQSVDIIYEDDLVDCLN